MQKIRDKSIDVIVTSPPYNIKVNYNLYKDNLPYEEYLVWIKSIFIEIKRILCDDGSFFLNIGCSFKKNPWLLFDIVNIAKEFFILQNYIIWVKSICIDKTTYGNFMPAYGNRFLNNTHESIFHFTFGNVKLTRKAIGVPFVDKNNIKKFNHKEDCHCRGNCWFIPYQTRTKKHIHPATFPEQLPEMCIKLHGIKENMVVLDPFAGIGTTGIACKKLGIDSILIEIDDNYVKIIKEQLA